MATTEAFVPDMAERPAEVGALLPEPSVDVTEESEVYEYRLVARPSGEYNLRQKKKDQKDIK